MKNFKNILYFYFLISLILPLLVQAESLPLVRIQENPTLQFNSMQQAYNQAANGNTIQCRAALIKENFVFNRDIDVTIKGGYDSSFSSNTNGQTLILGSGSLTKGRATFENIITCAEDTVKKPQAVVLNYADPMYQGAYLGWNSVSGALGYIIKYGTASGAYTDAIPVANVTNYTVTGLTNHVDYFFVVTAYNYYGESGNSNEIMVTPHLRDPNNENTPPTITNFVPADKARYTEGDTINIQVKIEDEVYHYDAVECQFLIDNQVAQSWSVNTTYVWQTSSNSFGEHRLKVLARDEYGAQSESSERKIFITHKPISPP